MPWLLKSARPPVNSRPPVRKRSLWLGIVRVQSVRCTTPAKAYQAHYASVVTEAKGLVAQGKGGEKLKFEDLNTGGRTRAFKSPAQSVLDYFDPEGPFNSELSAARIKPGTRVLIVIPQNEVQPLKGAAKKIAKSLPAEIRAQTVEVDADHLHAPDAAKAAVRDWLLAL